MSVDCHAPRSAALYWHRSDATAPDWTGFDRHHNIAGLVARFDHAGTHYWMGFLHGHNLPGKPRFGTPREAMAAVEATDHVSAF
jgi:hypothetical protein